MRRKPASQRWKVVALRLDPALLKRLDRVVERKQRTGTFVTRSDLVRMMIVHGLDEEESK